MFQVFKSEVNDRIPRPYGGKQGKLIVIFLWRIYWNIQGLLKDLTSVWGGRNSFWLQGKLVKTLAMNPKRLRLEKSEGDEETFWENKITNTILEIGKKCCLEES